MWRKCEGSNVIRIVLLKTVIFPHFRFRNYHKQLTFTHSSLSPTIDLLSIRDHRPESPILNHPWNGGAWQQNRPSSDSRTLEIEFTQAPWIPRRFLGNEAERPRRLTKPPPPFQCPVPSTVFHFLLLLLLLAKLAPFLLLPFPTPHYPHPVSSSVYLERERKRVDKFRATIENSNLLPGPPFIPSLFSISPRSWSRFLGFARSFHG